MPAISDATRDRGVERFPSGTDPWAAPFQLSRPAIREYMTLLARIFLLEELPPWHSNRLSRLIKTTKVHLGDTGLACALLGMEHQLGWNSVYAYNNEDFGPDSPRINTRIKK